MCSDSARELGVRKVQLILVHISQAPQTLKFAQGAARGKTRNAPSTTLKAK
jgi:hypothetical protein